MTKESKARIIELIRQLYEIRSEVNDLSELEANVKKENDLQSALTEIENAVGHLEDSTQS